MKHLLGGEYFRNLTKRKVLRLPFSGATCPEQRSRDDNVWSVRIGRYFKVGLFFQTLLLRLKQKNIRVVYLHLFCNYFLSLKSMVSQMLRTDEHISQFARLGLRTLVLGHKIITQVIFLPFKLRQFAKTMKTIFSQFVHKL